ncbi:hypothetical protein EXIGLDRAFT_767923 [Exidia glandulosa HHB12029]|uniref:Uncharacterized protein n=1 Tax=Exidia glandulosa HHB12029 TaxID=1314781 RepID=A0A165IMN7_EXIGL|nr:hypothetical protein EXIGLDRAFT_767923 [Exidia glandulosa HHB12029]
MPAGQAFYVTSYEQSTLHASFAQFRAERLGASIHVAVYYDAERLWKPSSTSRRKICARRRTRTVRSFAFTRESFNDLELDKVGKRVGVLTSILDGHISTDRSKARLDDKCDGWSTDEGRPESIACERTAPHSPRF